MQTTPMNFKNGVTIAVLLLIIFFSVGKISKQVQTFVGSGNNLAQVTTAPTAPTGLTAVAGECGGKVNASWNAVSGATYYELVRWPGGTALRSERTTNTDTAPAVSTRYEYQVRAVNSAGSSALPANSVAVVTSGACVAGPTPTVTLSASPISITSGSSSKITWSSTNATSCTASGAWSGTQATSGTSTVSPTATATYTLNCTGTSGSTSGSTTVSVSAPAPSAPTLTLSASPTSITAGQSSTISWSGTNATSCTATGGWSGTNGASGSQTVTPSTTKTYTLDCTGAGGSVSKSVTVSVTTPTTTAPKFKTGDYAQTTAGVNVRSTAGGSIAGKQVNGSLGTIISGPGQSTKSADPYWNVDFTTGTDGWVLENYLKQTTTAPTPVPPVTPAPTLTISASPATLTSGSSSTLTWSSTNATSCSASGAWSGTKAVSSSEAVTPTSTSTYTLVCTGTGGSASKSVTVTVSTPAPSTTYKAGDSVATTTSVNVRDAANGNLLGTKNTGDNGVVLSGGTYAGGYHWWNVDYVNAPDGWTAESFLTTYTLPPVVTLSANPASITNGGSSTLSWNATGATSCSAPWTTSTTTSSSQTVSPTATTTYTISCTGAGGVGSDSKTLTVTSNALPMVTLTPSPATLATGGGSSTLTWNSTNATSCTASGAWTGTKATSGSEAVSLTATSTYNLSCTGQGGTITQSAMVTVGSTTTTLRMNFIGTQTLNVFAGFNLIGSVFGDNGTSTSNVDVTVQNPIPNSTFKWAEGDCCIQSNGTYYFYKGNGDIAYRISTSASTPPGSYAVVLTAKDRANGATTTLNIPITVLPAPQPLATQTPGTPPALSAITKYVSDMKKYGLTYCNQSISPGVETGVWYYDGERVYYNLADYTGDPTWSSNCAQWVESMYRNYVITNNGAVPGWRRFPKGLRMDFERTGDTQSQSAALMLAKTASYPLKWNVEQESSREIAYSIDAMIDAEKLGAARNPKLQDMVDMAVGHMDQWVVSKNAKYLPPFMVALTSEALISWYELTGDPRVPVLVKAAADFMWNTLWDATSQSFPYYDRTVTGQGSRKPAPDLNNLISPIYGWIYYKTGDISYVTKGDQLFTGGVNNGWLGNGKQYSQNYRWSMHYLKWTNRLPAGVNISPLISN